MFVDDHQGYKRSIIYANPWLVPVSYTHLDVYKRQTLGFSAFHLVGLILGESLVIALIGGGIGITLTYPIVAGFEEAIPKGFFPFFFIEPITTILAMSAAILIGILASIFPIQRALKTNIVDGFRFVG